MLKTTKHVQAIYQELHDKLNFPFITNPNSSLNDKYGVAGNAESTERYRLNLVGLSLHGSPLITEPDFVQRRQSPTDVDVPYSVPFLAKPTTTPLTTQELETYRCIVDSTIGGVAYKLCYLKKVKPTGISISTIEATTTGLSGSVYIQPTNAQTPPYKQNVNLNDNTYVGVSGTFGFEITSDELVSIRDAIVLLYPAYEPLIGGFGFYISQQGSIEDSNILLDTSVRYKLPLTEPTTLTFDMGGAIPIHTVV